ncbi:MAG: GNAT family N-acetyltransferase [Atopobiaceae bacterium]
MLNVLLIAAIVLGSLMGGLANLLMSPLGSDYTRYVALAVAILCIYLFYQLLSVLLLRRGVLSSEDLSQTKPQVLHRYAPVRKGSVTQQIQHNLSQLDLPENQHEASQETSAVGVRGAATPVSVSTGIHGTAGTHAAAGTRGVAGARGAAGARGTSSHAATPHAAAATQRVAAAQSMPVQPMPAQPVAAAQPAMHAQPMPAQPASSSCPVYLGGHTGNYDELRADDTLGIQQMGQLSSSIVKEHFDPIIGAAQNDYMIARFNTAEAVSDQIRNHGYRYFFVCDPQASASADATQRHVGFLAFYPREEGELYLSKFYLRSDCRGRGLSRDMCRFVVDQARALGCNRITLNVNRNNYQAILAYEHLGFRKVRAERNPIGNGFVMDDFVYQLDL